MNDHPYDRDPRTPIQILMEDALVRDEPQPPPSYLVKNLAAESKKNLAREILSLRARLEGYQTVIDQIKESEKRRAKSAPAPELPKYLHKEAFCLMTYIEQNPSEGAPPKTLLVWNSRDGVTPFVVHIGESRFQHDLSQMAGPFYDRPEVATHEWVTRTTQQILDAWDRTMTQASETGRMDPEKAKGLKGDLVVAKSWNYAIGLRNMATGLFTDEEVLQIVKARVRAEDLMNAFWTQANLSLEQAKDCTELVMQLFEGQVEGPANAQPV